MVKTGNKTTVKGVNEPVRKAVKSKEKSKLCSTIEACAVILNKTINEVLAFGNKTSKEEKPAKKTDKGETTYEVVKKKLEKNGKTKENTHKLKTAKLLEELKPKLETMYDMPEVQGCSFLQGGTIFSAEEAKNKFAHILVGNNKGFEKDVLDRLQRLYTGVKSILEEITQKAKINK